MSSDKVNTVGLHLAIALVLLLASTVRAEEPAALAGRILESVDRPVGLAHLPRCGDGALGLALAQADDGLYVHGQDADGSAVAVARKAADEAGLLNRRASFDRGGLSRLLPAGSGCDLVVLTDLKRDELTPALAAEIRRVLHPWYGVAVLGDASGRLSISGLKKWSDRIAPDVSELPGDGSLVVVKAGPLEGADNWSHYWHGPDNNAVSADMAYGVPETVQWTGKPYFFTRIELPIVANGDRLLVADGATLLVLDQATGEELHRVEMDCGEIRWMAATAEHLLLVGGPRFHNPGGRRSEKNIVAFRKAGLELMVLDGESLTTVWKVSRQEGPDAFDPRSHAAADGNIIVTLRDGGLICVSGRGSPHRGDTTKADCSEKCWSLGNALLRRECQRIRWDMDRFVC